MNKNILLECLQEFTEATIKDLLLPVRMQKEDGNNAPLLQSAKVYRMRLPDTRAHEKKAPYIIHQIITGDDKQQPGSQPEARAVVRSVFCVYNANEQEGALMLLNLMERLRIALLQKQVIGGQFQLNLQAGLEGLIYPDPPVPYYMGEMISNWSLPPVQREYKLDYMS